VVSSFPFLYKYTILCAALPPDRIVSDDSDLINLKSDNFVDSEVRRKRTKRCSQILEK
jgi:hypothetical protein